LKNKKKKLMEGNINYIKWESMKFKKRRKI